MKIIHSSIATIFFYLCLTSISIADEYKIAVRAINGIETANKKWQATSDYLTKSIPEHSFKLVPIIKLHDVLAAAAVGEVDFVLTNPSSFVEIRELHQAMPLATLNNKRGNQPLSMFGTVIFTQATRTDILTLKDLKNKTLMAVSEPAFGGWQTAWLELLKNGIDPYRDIKKILFANGIQKKVVLSVLNGETDAGVVRTDQLERMANKGEIDLRYFRILNNKYIDDFPFFLSTDLYPEWPFAALSHVNQKTIKQVKAALLTIRPEHKAAADGHYSSWLEPSNYQSVKDLMLKLKVGPFTR
ncbi:MAG: phosphate/phosphite/phosphonate ABC transporter substrate-binding protein [Gammaproteobacteria bacterium]|nr:phosphate/phosphite/phosphonate ABC transporter substrate-binding protein [Gammaproteobacteria bacterium]MCW8908999.1 phosphate/phosphite/phosphonate ABC transporter substrate-binding protein [Gammaproteobacteria bacterium]MCW9006178.1 phosphate/phosphite/phosphonate ABC transporter substrate-binding protein [Gammaproteobacteria bacterium]